MRITDFPPELLSSSYKMFLEQLYGQMGSVRIFVTDLDLNSSLGGLDKVLIKVHQLKGGAGFFGLEKVEQAAAAVQEELKIISDVHIVQDKENLKKLLTVLEDAISKIPSPESLIQITDTK